MRSNRLLLIAVALSASSCVVDVPELDSGGFACRSGEDCAEGFTCRIEPGQSTGRCVSENGSGGSCTNDNECLVFGQLCDPQHGQCWDPCSPFPSTCSDACAPNPANGGFSCVTCDAEHARCPGTEVCYGAATKSCRPSCTSNAQCAAPEQCVAQNGVSACVLPTAGCGNGQVDAGETCDDGAMTPGDGCSSACAVEPGWRCADAPSRCVDAAHCMSDIPCDEGLSCAADNEGDASIGTCTAPCTINGECASNLCITMYRLDGTSQQLCGGCPPGCSGGCQLEDPSRPVNFPGTICGGSCTPAATCTSGAQCGSVYDATCNSHVMCGADGSCGLAGDVCVDESGGRYSCQSASCNPQTHATVTVEGFGTDWITRASVNACVPCGTGCPSGASCKAEGSGNLFESYNGVCSCDDLPSGGGWAALGVSACGQGVGFGFDGTGDLSVAVVPAGLPNAGQVIAAWSAPNSNGFQRIYARRFDGNGWSGIASSDVGDGVSGPIGSGLHANSPQMAVASNGDIHIAFVDSNGRPYVKTLDSGTATWFTSASGSSPSGGAPISFALGRNDAPLVAFKNPTDTNIYVTENGGLTQLGTAVNRSAAGGYIIPTPAGVPALAVSPGFGGDGTQRVIVAATGGSTPGLFVRYYGTSDWANLSAMNGNGIANGIPAANPAITTMGNGQPVVAFECCGTAASPIRVKLHTGGETAWTWDGLGSLDTLGPPNGFRPTIARDSSDRLYVAYQTDYDAGAPQIVMQRYDGASWQGLDGSNNVSTGGLSNAPAGGRATGARIAVGPRATGAGEQVCVAWAYWAPGATTPSLYARCHDIL